MEMGEVEAAKQTLGLNNLYWESHKGTPCVLGVALNSNQRPMGCEPTFNGKRQPSHKSLFCYLAARNFYIK